MSGSQGFSLPIRVVEAGGVSAWLVEDHAVPVVSLSWAWRGGAALGRPRKYPWPRPARNSRSAAS